MQAQNLLQSLDDKLEDGRVPASFRS